MSIYDQELGRNAANFVPLSPVTFLERAATVHPDRLAVIRGATSWTWAETHARCLRLAAALRARGLQRQQTVAALLLNSPEMFEAHFGVPMAGGVLNAINVRLDARAIAFILDHGEARVLLVDRELGATAREALSRMQGPRPLVIDVCEPGTDLPPVSDLPYDALLAEGDPATPPLEPRDEWDAIALNYTSGTTGDPKGVVYHHRGAHLNALANVLAWDMVRFPTYLWTLPMFHCNGWCFPWTLAAVAGTSVCLRHVRADAIFEAIHTHRVSHLCGAPVVLSTMLAAPDEVKGHLAHPVHVMTAGAAPPAAVLEEMEGLGFRVCHVYGLTEVYGPATVCTEQTEWASLSTRERADRQARQGVRNAALEELRVVDPGTRQPVPRDGATLGEVFMRGNNVMKGYLKNPRATQACFEGGYFHTGDLAVWHPDGYIEIKDRSKDIIISGGENISSIEVEGALFRHPQIVDAAVVAVPHPKWGETPCAFVTLAPGASLEAQDVIDHCRALLAHFKAPTRVIFGPIEKTSTGKVQKFELRARATQ